MIKGVVYRFIKRNNYSNIISDANQNKQKEKSKVNKPKKDFLVMIKSGMKQWILGVVDMYNFQNSE